MDKALLGQNDRIEVLMKPKVIEEESRNQARVPLLPNAPKLVKNLTPKITINETSVGKAVIVFGETIAAKLERL